MYLTQVLRMQTQLCGRSVSKSNAARNPNRIPGGAFLCRGGSQIDNVQ